MTETRLHLTPAQFGDKERPLLEFGPLTATAFRFDSGVCAVRLTHARASLTLLPYQGQQIWQAVCDGRDLTMRSMFAQPWPTRDFLATFGGFMQHCGATGVGNPTAEDAHPLHGELPNAPYHAAYLVTGEDARGAYLGLGGAYRHTIAFAHNYVAEPLVKLYADSTLFNVTMRICNEKQSDMELLYLAHINFRPIDNGRLVYSAPSDPQHVRVRTTIPSHVHPGADYTRFIEQLAEDPSLHEIFKPGLAFDPEVVFFMDYVADDAGWGHTLQIHPNGRADYVRHRLAELPRATRWISRTPDQDAVALVEVGTCEPDGYTAEKRKGHIVVLGPGEQFEASFDVGALDAAEAQRVAARVEQLLAQRAA